MKTLAECKDDVAIQHHHDGWKAIKNTDMFETLINGVAHTYASQYKELNAELVNALKDVVVIAKKYQHDDPYEDHTINYADSVITKAEQQ